MEKLMKLVEKGVYITPQQIEKFTGKSPEELTFGLTLMYVCKLIKDHYPEVSVKIENGGIAILDDLRASKYHRRLFAQRLSGMERAHSDSLTRVDSSNIIDIQIKKEHDRGIEIMGKVITAARNALVQEMPELTPIKRSVRNMLSI